MIFCNIISIYWYKCWSAIRCMCIKYILLYFHC